MTGFSIEALFAPGDGSPDHLATAQQRLLAFTSLCTCAIATLWMSVSVGEIGSGRPLFTLFCVVTPFLFLPFSILSARWPDRAASLSQVFIGVLYAAITLVAGSIGGAVSTTSFFLVLVPTLATFLIGLKGGAVWLAVVALTFLGFHTARTALPDPPFALTPEDVSFWNGLTLTLAACALAASAALFSAAIRKSNDLLLQAKFRAKEIEAARSVAESINRSQSEFIANMSHELRTPLNAIIGYGEILLDNAESDGRGRDAADTRRVLVGAGRLREMVDGIIQRSMDVAPCQPTPCDVAELVRTATMAMMPTAAENGSELTADAERAMGIWLCDREKLSECLRHLLSNAAKFTRHGHIRVTVRTEHSTSQTWLVLSIADTGIGIAPAVQERLFVPFSQADSSLTRAHQGPGLGLAITRRLARAMGGEIELASTRPGAGSVFLLRLPVVRFPDAEDGVR